MRRYKFLKFMRYAFLIGAYCCWFNSSHAHFFAPEKNKYDERKADPISGVVTQENGEPLAGVTVTVKGTSISTQTDAAGRFSINASPESVLVFTSVGYIDQEVKAGNQTSINVQLKMFARDLQQVVVVGYGTQTKKEISSAVASVKASDFNKGNINDPAQLLQGKVAGLTISRPGGDPNGGYNIRLRGLSTLGANTQPLVIIDGVIGADLNSVDPSDIASMDVLKDGSAAAIYGTRGSSGVILITTKSGTRGRTQVDYNGYVSAENVARSVQVMNAEQYKAIGGPDYGGDTKWIDAITRTGISHVHNLALSGGAENTTYRISLNYRNIQGVALTTGFNQLNGRINLTQRALNNRLTLNINLASTSKAGHLGFNDAFRYATIYSPTAPVNSTDAAYEKYAGYFQKPLFDFYNPVGILKQNLNDQQVTRLTINAQADYRIIQGLKASLHYAQNKDNYFYGQYFSKQSYWMGADRNGLASRTTDDFANQLFEATGTYDKRFGGLNATVLGGYSYQEFTHQYFYAQGGNFLTDAFTYNNLSAAKDFQDGKGTIQSSKDKNKLIAFFGRVNLNYDNMLFVSASIRREGSTRFGEGNKWGNFPAVSAALDVNRLTRIPAFDILKVRASYGITGALPEQSYLSLVTYGPNGQYFLNNGQYVPVYAPQSNPNPNLKWETKREYDFGLDFSLYNSKISGSLDYYRRTTKDALITLPVSVPPNLFSTSLLNVGQLQNNGFELALNYLAVQKGNFTWNAKAVFSTYNTKIVSLSANDIQYGVRDIANLGAPGQNNTPLIRVQEGKPLGQIWGLMFDDFTADSLMQFKDIDKNGTIDNNDRAVIGNGLPKWEAGLTNSFTYRNFDVNFTIRGVFGHDLVNTYRAFYEARSQASIYNVVNTKYFNPAFKGGATFSSYDVEDASFAKLDNASIGYNFRFANAKKGSSLRVYLSGQNLFYITKYTGVDPEVRFSYSDGGVLAPGIDDRNTWYRTRTVTFGANLSF